MNTETITDANSTLKAVSDKLGDLLPTDAFVRGAQAIVDDQRRIVEKYGVENVRQRQVSDALEALADLSEALGHIEAMRQLWPKCAHCGETVTPDPIAGWVAVTPLPGRGVGHCLANPDSINHETEQDR